MEERIDPIKSSSISSVRALSGTSRHWLEAEIVWDVGLLEMSRLRGGAAGDV